MVQLLNKKKIIKLWYEEKSYVWVRRRFCQEFNINTHTASDRKAVWKVVNQFESKGTIRDSHKGNSGRPLLVTRD